MNRRDQPFSIEFSTGDGNITYMLQTNGCMYIFKPDCHLIVNPPESIDPDQTNDHLPWSGNTYFEFGSKNQIIARLLLQTCEIMKSVPLRTTVNKKEVTDYILQGSVHLVKCQSICEALNVEVQSTIDSTPIGLNHFNSQFIALPRVENVNGKAASFLTHMKLYLQFIAKVVGTMFNKIYDGPHFHKILSDVENKYGIDDQLASYLRETQPWVKTLVHMRDALEHPKKNPDEALLINDFSLQADMSIRPPHWIFKKGNVNGDIVIDMVNMTEGALVFGENMILACLDKIKNDRFPIAFYKVPDQQIDPNLPIRVRATIDPSKLKMNMKPAIG